VKIGYGDKMATDVNVTTASWGTENLKKATGEIYDKTAQNQIADNTGFNLYRPELACEQMVTADDNSFTQYTYMSAGTYQAYAIGSKHIDVAGTISVSLDGTNLYFNTTAGATFTGSDAEVIIASDGWVAAVFTHVDTGGAGSLKYCTICTRQKG
jgi:hypothetical protein